ncbi:hypothetical protein OV079_42980 [Nannocystis pusilla]|uniref:Uncharacterized protein n=1 Tax=Nannocystis pusilla TaxID=889268 RepID=A0A9X3J2W3_9BACT|nr:hypothetical protein [Nannocystis pusilla]MCY1012194.1 hypothetical protein [Nannocystis pusilla]
MSARWPSTLTESSVYELVPPSFSFLGGWPSTRWNTLSMPIAYTLPSGASAMRVR